LKKSAGFPGRPRPRQPASDAATNEIVELRRPPTMWLSREFRAATLKPGRIGANLRFADPRRLWPPGREVICTSPLPPPPPGQDLAYCSSRARNDRQWHCWKWSDV